MPPKCPAVALPILVNSHSRPKRKALSFCPFYR